MDGNTANADGAIDSMPLPRRNITSTGFCVIGTTQHVDEQRAAETDRGRHEAAGDRRTGSAERAGAERTDNERTGPECEGRDRERGQLHDLLVANANPAAARTRR